MKHESIFGHRRYGSAIHGPDTELDGATERALVRDFSTLEAYWADPSPFEAAKREGQQRLNEAFNPNALQKMQAIWDREGQRCNRESTHPNPPTAHPCRNGSGTGWAA